VTGTLGGQGVSVFDHAGAEAGTLSLFGNVTVEDASTLQAANADINGTVSVDGTAAFEVGTGGGTPARAMSVDAGATYSGSGAIDAPLVNNGVLVATSPLTLDGPVSGSGVEEISFQGLVLKGSVGAGQTIEFSTPAELDLSGAASMFATITGFTTGDGIIAAPAVARSVFTPTGGGFGTLALEDGSGTTLQTLTIEAPAAGDAFFVLPGFFGGASTIEVAASAEVPALGTSAYLASSSGPGYILPGTTVSATDYGVASGDVPGPLLVSGDGAVLSVSGTLTLGQVGPHFTTNSTLDVANHATAQVGTFIITGGSTLAVDGTGVLELGSAGGADAGFLTVDAGETLAPENVDANVMNNGTIGGLPSITGDVLGTGDIAVGGLTAVNGDIGPGQSITFLGPGGVLAMHAASTPAAISGMVPGDAINITDTPIDAASYVPTGAGSGILTATHDGTVVSTLTLDGTYAGDTFLVAPDPNFGNDIFLVAGSVACFVEGTRILTGRGPVAVEDIRADQRVVLARGGTARVTWLGHRRIDCRP
jgi:hypothetical protein